MTDGPNPAALLTASQLAAYFGVTVAAVCNWASNGWLEPARGRAGQVLRNSRGHVLYRLIDGCRAEARASAVPQCHRKQRAA